MRAEHERGAAGRFAPGLPRISDGQLLFLLHMLAHAKEPEGGRLAHRHHHERLAALHRRRRQRRERDPPLHPGERLARSADRAARAALLQHRHRHLRLGGDQPQGAGAQGQGAAHRRHVVLGADAQEPRRQAPRDPARSARRTSCKILADFKDGDTRTVTKDGKEEEVVVSRIFPTTHFGFRKITVERPLRLNFQASPERIARLEEEKGFQALAQSKKKGAAGAKEQAEGRALQEAIRELVRGLPGHARSRTATSSSALLDAAAREGRPEAPGAGPEGHPLRALRARRDGRDLPRQGRQPGARPGAARHRERPLPATIRAGVRACASSSAR